MPDSGPEFYDVLRKIKWLYLENIKLVLGSDQKLIAKSILRVFFVSTKADGQPGMCHTQLRVSSVRDC